MGWVPAQTEWWESIADALPKPWPREAILMDLRWWADQVRLGEAVRPGRVELARRWGVTDWQVKVMLKSEDEWGDPAHATDARPIPPAHRQPTASRPPADRQPTEGGTPNMNEDPPAHRQPTASAPPGHRPARDYNTGPQLHNPQEQQCAPPALPAWAKKASVPNGVLRAEVVELVVAVRNDVLGTVSNPDACGTASKAVLGLWRAVGFPSIASFRDDLLLVARAARECPDPLFARDVRAEGWAGGVDRQRDLATLCRHDRWDVRLATAKRWVAGDLVVRGVPRPAHLMVFSGGANSPEEPDSPMPDPDPAASRLWDAVLLDLRSTLDDPRAVDVWLARCVPVGVSENELRIVAANRYYCEWIRDHYAADLDAAAGRRVSVEPNELREAAP